MSDANMNSFGKIEKYVWCDVGLHKFRKTGCTKHDKCHLQANHDPWFFGSGLLHKWFQRIYAGDDKLCPCWKIMCAWRHFSWHWEHSICFHQSCFEVRMWGRRLLKLLKNDRSDIISCDCVLWALDVRNSTYLVTLMKGAFMLCVIIDTIFKINYSQR